MPETTNAIIPAAVATAARPVAGRTPAATAVTRGPAVPGASTIRLIDWMK